MAKRTKTIGRYVLRKRLGGGLNGEVFLADDPNLGRQVAVKVLYGGDGSCLDRLRFPREARAVGRLRHPNVVSVYDAGHTDDNPYLVFEFIDGITLHQLLATQGAMEIGRAAALATQVLDGLAHAHAHDVVHLDLSPRNIILDRQGTAKIMDFGLARLADSPVTADEEVTGTLLYMSPEHLSRENLGPHSDVYALGLILHEVLTGQSAVRAGRVTDVLRRVACAVLDLEPLTAQEVDPAFVRLLLDAVRADPDARYRDAGAMRDALEDWQLSREREGDAPANDENHSTVAFLLRRMKRRKDFPAISQSLLEVNRLLAPDSVASANQLAGVILRDYALTSKLLKLANSAFYGPSAGKVSNVSAAITLLGFERVRLAANSLTFFGFLNDGDDNARLRDLLHASFMAGLITRHLVRTAKLPDPEGAFVAGLFQRLGKALARFYFIEDDEDIETAMAEHRIAEDTATRGVLGITYADLGVAVGRSWGFPDELLRCMREIDAQDPLDSAAPADQLRYRAVFANQLCALVETTPPGGERAALDAICDRFSRCIALEAPGALELLAQARGKFSELAGALGVNAQTSALLSNTLTFVANARNDLGIDTERQPLSATS